MGLLSFFLILIFLLLVVIGGVLAFLYKGVLSVMDLFGVRSDGKKSEAKAQGRKSDGSTYSGPKTEEGIRRMKTMKESAETVDFEEETE